MTEFGYIFEFHVKNGFDNSYVCMVVLLFLGLRSGLYLYRLRSNGDVGV